MSNELGLTIPISAALTSRLKKLHTDESESQHRGHGRQQVRVNNNWKQHISEDDSDVDSSSHGRKGSAAALFQGKSNIDAIVDEDRTIMPFVRPELSSKDNIVGEKSLYDSENTPGKSDKDEDSNDNDNEDDKSNSSDYSDSDQVSLSPPSCMPILAVDLEQLCGYKPSDDSDIKRLTDDIYETLLGSKHQDLAHEYSQDNPGHKKESTYSGDINYVQFTERSAELFESGIAYHSDTVSSQKIHQESTTAIIPYPEFLPIPRPLIHQSQDQDQELRASLMATSKMWKEIIRPHSIPVVHRLLVLLSKCSRSILWKYEMSTELRRLAKSEQRCNTDRMRKKHLNVWRNETRPAELAKLYEVRETFEYKLELAREKYDQIMKDKEVRVQCELRRRKEQGIGMGGVSGLDWDGKETFAFADDDENIVNSLIKDEENEELKKSQLSEDDDDNDMAGYEHDDDFSSESSHNNGYDSSHGELVDKNIPDPLRLMVPKQTISVVDRKKRRVAAASKRMRRKLESEKEKARLLELQQRIKSAHDEEEQMRKICSTTEEKVELAVVSNLEKKLEKVDSLLEIMQEEEWKDQEEGVMMDEGLSDDEFIGEQHSDGSQMSLIDQILAMILGAFQPLGKPAQTHFAELKKEHKEIKSGWKSTFGRLPLSFVESCHTHELPVNEPIATADKKSNSDGTWDDDILSGELQGSLKLQDSGEKNAIPRSDVRASNTTAGLHAQEMEGPNNSSERNIPDDWENIDDWSDLLLPRNETIEEGQTNNQYTPEQKLKSDISLSNQTPKCETKIGLRPGGTAKL